MKRGAWHQFGDRSQRLALEQLKVGRGVGVVISPRDLSPDKAAEYVLEYIQAGAEVLYDPQFFLPDSQVGKLSEWSLNNFRLRASSLGRLTSEEYDGLSSEIEAINRHLHSCAIIAPAVLWSGSNQQSLETNRRLFECAKRAGDAIGVPTYGTIFLGRGATQSVQQVITTLSDATSVPTDGWYFGFEFAESRIPGDLNEIQRFLIGTIKLAATGKNLVAGYLGPLSLLACAVGASGLGVTHSQNMWGFSAERWRDNQGGGGGGNAPPRYFSRELWGTLVYPDEISKLPGGVPSKIIRSTPFSAQVSIQPPYVSWSRWDAGKHLVYEICTEIDNLVKLPVRERVSRVLEHLDSATKLYDQISGLGIRLQDRSDSYQLNWKRALEDVANQYSDDLDLIEILA